MNWDFLILGSLGTQGRITSRALLEKGYRLFLTDLYREGVESLLSKYSPLTVGFKMLDIREKDAVLDVLKEVRPSVVINCAEGDYNLDIYNICLEAGFNVIDLGSDIDQTKGQLDLDNKFKQAGLIAITGCGSTPGINNVMLKYAAREFDSIETIEVGFAWDSNLKEFVLPFSIGSVLYELSYPAPYIEDSIWKENKAPLEYSEIKRFDLLGQQECFIVHHSETYSFDRVYKDKGVKNIRFYASFPPHCINVLRALIKLGVASEANVLVENGTKFIEVSPLDVLTQVLKRNKMPENYEEVEILWLNIIGQKEGVSHKVNMECVVNTLKDWEFAGSNIDTGITAGIIAEMIERKEIKSCGSFVPEQIIPEVLFFNRLADYGMKVYKDKLLLNGI